MNSKVKQIIDGNNNNQTNIGQVIANLNSTSSIIAIALPRIAELVSTDEIAELDITAFDINDKITYNNVKSFKVILDEFGRFGTEIDSIYDIFENENPGFKGSVSSYFRTKYLLMKQKIAENNPEKELIELIRENADLILSTTISNFKEDLKQSNNVTIRTEEIEAVAVAVVCHAFVMCKILEKPTK